MCPGVLTCEVLLVLVHALALHLHHPPLDAPVADVTEVLHVLLHPLRDGVGHHGREAAFALLKVLVVLHLQSQRIVIPQLWLSQSQQSPIPNSLQHYKPGSPHLVGHLVLAARWVYFCI